MTGARLSLWAIFGVPIVLAVLSLIGLFGALLGDGAWDGVGAVLLGTAVAAIVWALARARVRSRS